VSYDDTLKIFAGIDTTGVKSGMKDIKSLVGKGMNALKTTASAGVSAVSTVTEAVTGAVTAAGSGVLALGGYSVKVGKNFESSMSQVIATMGITKDTIQDGENSYEKLAAKAKEMGATTKFSASEAADALNYLALAGYDATKACNALPAVLNLAQAGNMDLAYASDLATDAMSALGMDATIENLTHFGDVLAKTASSSNTSVAQLGEAILVCGGQSKLAGLELEEMSTVLGILADNGIKGSEGGTALRNLLKNLYTPTSQASKAMAELGIQTATSDGKLREVQDVLFDTLNAVNALSEADRITAMGDIFDVRTIAAANAAVNNSSERFDELYGKITDCDGAMEQMAKTQNDNLEGDIYGLKSAFEAVGVSVYENLNLSIRNAVQLGTSYLRKLNDTFNKTGFDGLASSLGNILGDILTKISSKIPDVINIGKSVVKSFIQGISDNSGILGESVSEIVTSLAECVIELYPEFIRGGGQLVMSFADGIAGNLPVLLEKAENLIEWLYEGLIENLPKVIDFALKLVEDFGEKLSENSGKIVSAGVEIITIFVDGIKKGIPKVIKIARQVIKDFADALGKEVPVLKPFTKTLEFISDHFEEFAGIALGVWTAFKGYTIISKAAKAFELLGTVIKTSAKAMGANPFGVALVAISGITAALMSIDFMAGEHETQLDKAIEKEKEYLEKARESRQEFENLKDNALEKASQNIAPVEHVSDLAKELENLADASGRVQDSDVERVSAILETMNDVLGTDYKLVDGQIQKYDELKKSIDDVIEKKRAEILLDANSEVYEEAIKKYRDNENQLNQKKSEIDSQEKIIKNLAVEVGYSIDSPEDIYEIARGDIDSVYAEFERLVESGKIDTDIYDFDAWLEQIDYIQKMTDEYKLAKDSYKELETTADLYYQTIGNYESAMGAISSGDYEKAVEILNASADSINKANLHIGESTAESAVKLSELQKQTDEFQTEYDRHLEKYKSNVDGYTNAIVNEDKAKLAESRIELYKMAAEAEKNGQQSLLDSMSEAEQKGFENYSAVKKLEENYEKDKAKLEELEKRYAETGSKGTEIRIQKLKDKLYNEEKGLEAVYMRAGAKTSDAFGGEMSSDERLSRYVSTFAGKTVSFFDEQKEYLNEEIKKIGSYAADGFSDGIWEKINNIRDTCQNAVDSVVSFFRQGFIIGSPSKLMRDEVGKWILPGISVGVEDTVDDTARSINSSLDGVMSQVDTPKAGMFTQQIELLREFQPENNIPQIEDERFTEEIQTKLDEFFVNLNADDFISKFENILGNIGYNAVPQYSQVYSQIQYPAENHENNKFELPKNSGQNTPKISVFIGDTEIRDFVISTINEANAVSGGASF